MQGCEVLAKHIFCLFLYMFLKYGGHSTAYTRIAYVEETDQWELDFVYALWRG